MKDLNRSNGTSFYFDDFVIERDSFRLMKGGRLKSLEPRAFDVLIYLIENRERVVEKQEIFEAVWKETFVTDNALTRAVKEIRRELGDNAAAPRYIETVHKRGYRFIGELFDPEEETARKREAEKKKASIQTSNGQKNENQIPDPQSGIQNRKWLRIALPVFLLAIAALVFWNSGSRKKTSIESIAVLPFVNESGNPDAEYLSDGMTETLIGSLSQLPNLAVKARSSVFLYKGKDVKAQNLGKDLNVQAVLTGRVVERGDELTLYLALVDTATGNNLWSKQYSRKMTNLVALQNEISRDVVRSIGAKLSGADERRLAKNYTANPEAYQLYLKGRYHVSATRLRSAETGMDFYRQAIVIDPNYALAYAGIAEAAIGLAFGSEAPMSEVVPQAKAAAAKAIELDDQLVEGHIALGTISFWFDWDWKAAENHFKHALELQPNSAEAHHSYGMLLGSTGRQEEGLAELKRAVELDPLNLRQNSVEAQYLSFAGRHDEAIDKLRKIIEMEPNFYFAYSVLASVYTEKEMYDDAVETLRSAQRFSNINSFPVAALGYALAKQGKQTEARALLEDLRQASRQRYISPYSFAILYHGLGEREEAFRQLELAAENRDLRIVLIKVEPRWKDLRSDPRFQEIVRRVGL